jgi:hypothetical protein
MGGSWCCRVQDNILNRLFGYLVLWR